jgi:soluble lytic murein transglycosylase-like protein
LFILSLIEYNFSQFGALNFAKQTHIKVAILNKILIAVAICLPITSFAKDVINAKTSIDSAIVTESNDITNSNLANEDIVDKLSDTASVNLESIDHQTLQSKSSSAISTKDKSNTKQTTTSTANKDPFSDANRYGSNSVNYTKAAEEFCFDARDKNNADAQYALGWMYEHGKGVTKDENIAVKFYSMAAKQFHQSARESLSASAGNPNIAKLPECMSKNYKPKDTNLADNTNEKAVKYTPFYVKGPIYRLVSKIAPRYNIETDLAMAFIAVESGFNPNATSAKNAQGLMQLIPETATRFKVKNAYDPEQNIKGGLAYLDWLLTYFEGDIKLVAAAYNAGENTVDKYKGIPPYPETQKYVKKIASLYKKSHHPYREKTGNSKKSANNHFSG